MIAKQIIRLTEKNLTILKFLEKFGVCNERHLVKILDYQENHHGLMCLKPQINKMISGDYIERHKLYFGEAAYIKLTKFGAAYLGTRTDKQIRINTLHHDMLVIDLYLSMTEKYPDYNIKSEREIRIEHNIKLNSKERVPDLLINDRVAVEVEISYKSTALLRKILRNYALNSGIDKVIYFIRNPYLAHKIYEESHYSSKFMVYSFEGDNIKDGQEVTPKETKQNIINEFDFDALKRR